MHKSNAENRTEINVAATTSSCCSDDGDDSNVGELMEKKGDGLYIKHSKAVVNTLTIIPNKSIKSRKLKRTLRRVLRRDTRGIDFYSYRDIRNMDTDDTLMKEKEKSVVETNPELDKMESDIQANEGKNNMDGQTADKTMNEAQNNEFEEAIDGISRFKLADDGPTDKKKAINVVLGTLSHDDVAQESDSAIEIFVDAREYHEDTSKNKDNEMKKEKGSICSDEETCLPEGEYTEEHQDSDDGDNKTGLDDATPNVKEKRDDREKGDGEDGSQSGGEENDLLANNDHNIEEEDTEDGVKLDDDEDCRKPQYVPKGKRYYAHDDRTTASLPDEEHEAVQSKEPEGEKPAKPVKNAGRKSGIADKRWQHDKYNENMQGPKTKEEIEESYGYEMRGEMSAPRGRRGRRYGRNQGPYVPSWKQGANANVGSSDNIQNEYVQPPEMTRKSEVSKEESNRQIVERPIKLDDGDQHGMTSRVSGGNRGRGRRNPTGSRENEFVRSEGDEAKAVERNSNKEFEIPLQRECRRGGKSRGWNNYREEGGVSYQDPSNSQSYDTHNNNKNVQKEPGRSGEDVDQERLGGEKGSVISRKLRYKSQKDRSEQESHHSQAESQGDQPARNIRYSSQSKRDLPETIINADTVIKSTGSGRNDTKFNSGQTGYSQRRDYERQGDRGYHSGMSQKSGRGFPASQRGQNTRYYDHRRKPRRGGIGYSGATQASVPHVQMNAGANDGELSVGTQGQVYAEQQIAYIAPYPIMGSTTHPTANAPGPGLNYVPGPAGIRPPPVLTPMYPVPQIPSDVYRARLATPPEVFHARITRPPSLGPHPNVFQSHSGVTYYSTQSQIRQRFLPPRRVKTAIPILPPPEPEQESEQDASQSDNKEY